MFKGHCLLINSLSYIHCPCLPLATAADSHLGGGGIWEGLAGLVTLWAHAQVLGLQADRGQEGDACTGAHALSGEEGPPRGALLSRLSFSFHQHHFQRMMSLDNDSIIHASYSSIPTDPSLTVLKLSIKQRTGGGKKGTSKSCSFQALLMSLKYPHAPHGGSRDPGSPHSTLLTPLLDPTFLGDGGCFYVPHGAEDKSQTPGCALQNHKFRVRIIFWVEDGR